MLRDAGYLSVAIDIGGTFTDVVATEESSGRSHSHKELTTPDDPSRGVISGLKKLFERDNLKYSDVGRVIHATTLFANALIERKGATTGLITTQGFRDVLEIGHERKYELYNLYLRNPPPLVPRRLREQVVERTLAHGEIDTPLDEVGLLACAERLGGAGVESIAIVFLHAYANGTHERRARDLLLEHYPNVAVTISSEISPQIREYERTSTTVANAYVKPLANSYLDELGNSLRNLGITSNLFMMLSNGGLTNTQDARRRPIEMLESGPAAGALSAAHFGRQSEVRDVLAFDMGGTTAKLAVVDQGVPLIAHSFEAARDRRFIPGSGLPITISTIELAEIGAGGGSIAHLDQLGLLTVGPRSASSVPGPACYQRGGTEPTVTDANLILGYLDPDFFAGGTIKISRPVAEGSVGALADKIGMSPMETAWSIHNIVNESMASAARVHVAERGMDPRRYALLTTGGGGPLHGCEVARKLGILRVLCPPSAGVASAIGMLVAPARVDRARTYVRRVDEIDWGVLERLYSELEQDAQRVIANTGLDLSVATITRHADMRYLGQGFDIVVDLMPGPFTSEHQASILTRFEHTYRGIFKRTLTLGVPQIVNIRVSARSQAASRLRSIAHGGQTKDAGRKGSRLAYFDQAKDFVMTAVFDRLKLRPGSTVHGPAIIEEAESTLIVPPSGEAQIDASGNIVLMLRDVVTEPATRVMARAK
jgi:N-methylhydantoinase A